LKEKEELTRRGEAHMFTLFSGDSPAGSCSFRPYEDGYRADIGLWIGEPHQGRGLGTFAVGELVRYGFQRPEIRKVEASVFVGNASSRRIFEKNGFRVEGTIRLCCRKRERLLDEWLLGITREEYER
jgi:ribosomal-protein-alanine N-acetyltransferase